MQGMPQGQPRQEQEQRGEQVMVLSYGALSPVMALTPTATLIPPVAFSAAPRTVGVHVQVIAAVRMALRAMFSTRCLCRWGLPAQDVDAQRDWLQVGRADAVMGAALVVDGEASGDGANPVFVSPTVGTDRMTINPEATVSVLTVNSARPEPARRRLPNFGQEPLLNVHGLSITDQGDRGNPTSVDRQQLAPRFVGLVTPAGGRRGRECPT